jgi:hypothetical protein
MNPQTSQWRAEHRRNPRRVVYTKARIAIEGCAELINCRLIDISAGGARLDLPNDFKLPDFFVLVLSHDGRLRRQCAVMWRSPPSVGVEFIPVGRLKRQGIP